MKQQILYLLFLLTGVLSAQDSASQSDILFENANTAYRNGFYEEALSNYQQIDSLGLHSADLFYNLGNTYYKLNQVAPSIYYYEKALLSNPNHEDAKHNLIFAQRMTIDAFEVLPKSVFQKINERIIYPISYNTWAWISVFLVFLLSSFFLLYHFAKYTHTKRVFFILSFISIALFLISLSFTIKAKHYDMHNQPAIIFNTKVSVKSEPNHAALEAFELHEGTKVLVLENMDSWSKIKVVDGKIGWLLNDTFKKLK